MNAFSTGGKENYFVSGSALDASIQTVQLEVCLATYEAVYGSATLDIEWLISYRDYYDNFLLIILPLPCCTWI